MAGVVGGLALLAATAAPWGERGAGSSLALIEIADLILSGTVGAWVPRPVGLVIYAIPLGGALVLVGAGWGGRAGLVISIVGGTGAAAGTAAALMGLDQVGSIRLGAGVLCAGVGVAAAAVSVWAHARQLRSASPGAGG